MAFEILKRTLSTPPVLATPHEREPMLLYIAATNQVVSTALVVERTEEGKAHGVQRPVYSSARSYPPPSSGTRTTRSWRTVSSGQPVSYATTSRSTR